MIIELKPNVSPADIQRLCDELQAVSFQANGFTTLVTPSKLKTLDEKYLPFADRFVAVDDDIQLASKKYLPKTRTIRLGELVFGGAGDQTVVMAGPCSAESEAQIRQSAELCKSLGVKVLRAGCYKPRTSPYSFQGLGEEGLKLLAKMRDEFGLHIITEVRDHSHVQTVIDYADVIQIGAKSMYDHGILRACGKTQKPVLLKRGFGSTLQETVQAAEFILSGGNPNVMLCERGVRTFETKTRFTLDLSGAVYLKYHTNLPVVLDPSHGLGYAYGVPDLSRACVALGVDGILIEVHPTPALALSDASQQLDHETFRALHGSLVKVGEAVGRKIV